MRSKYFSTARLTGLWYLGLAVTGVLAFLFVRAKLYVPEDALATATNFIAQPVLARFGIAAELALVAFQALAALWFFKLFRKVDDFAAVSLATFGSINAVLILIANAFWLSAVIMAERMAGSVDPTLANTLFSLFEAHETIWIMGNLFFGLWLLPMGYLALKAKYPKALGWFLLAGGLGYVIAAFLKILSPVAMAQVIDLITLPATVGEFWMIGYLLVKKDR